MGWAFRFWALGLGFKVVPAESVRGPLLSPENSQCIPVPPKGTPA